LAVFLFPGGPKPSRVVFSAGKLSDFAGKKGKISASRDSTENCLPVLRSLNPRQSRKDKTNNYKAAKYPMYDSKRWNSFSYAGFHIFVVPSFIVNCEEQYCKIENKVKNQHSNSDIVNYHTLILLLRDTWDGSLCLFSLAVFLFPGGPKPSRVVFSAGKLAGFSGKQGENRASWQCRPGLCADTLIIQLFAIKYKRRCGFFRVV